MNRRTLFGRLATVAAAATVAAHVEPAQGDAAVATNTTELAKRCLACPWVGSWSSDISVERAIEQMREFSKHVTEAHGSRVTNSDTVWRRPYDSVPPVTISCGLGGATAADAIPLAVRAQPNGFAYRVGQLQ